MARVLVIGDVMTDVLVRVSGPIAWGSDTPALIEERPGGSGASQAIWLARAGLEVDFVARVGRADIERLREEFITEGVRAHFAADPELPTGRLVALVEASGERSFLTDRAANARLGPEDIPAGLAEAADWLHLTGYLFASESGRAAAAAARARSRAPFSVDPSSAAPLREMGADNFLAWTNGAAVILPNSDEAAVLTGTNDAALQGVRLRRRYGLVVIKRGSAGAEAYREGQDWTAAAAPTAAIDTTGAGDAFAAAFLAAHLGGANAPACLERAVAAGSAATTFVGGRPSR